MMEKNKQKRDDAAPSDDDDDDDDDAEGKSRSQSKQIENLIIINKYVIGRKIIRNTSSSKQSKRKQLEL